MAKSTATELAGKGSSFLESKVQIILPRLNTPQLKQAFAQAVKRSITFDINSKNVPRPSNVAEISKLYGFDVALQRSYFICINKQSAKEFLDDLGFTVKTNFDKVYNRPCYEDLFKRKPHVVGKRQMILTYAEWLHLVGFPYEPDLPKILTPFLK